ncbi:MAG: hypothetical protein ABSH41_05665 [Syntrophobacteraceae bacterium]|jgi:DNA-directed RNA polymerase specialized sigma24 family protein
MDKSKRELLKSADWERITLELAIYAKSRLVGKRWRSGTGNILAEGKGLQDLVQEAICKFFDESRNWDPQRVDLLGFLKGIVRSLTSGLAKSADNRLLIPSRLDEDSNEISPVPVETSTPEDILSENQDDQIIAELYERVLKRVEGDDDLENLVYCMLVGVHEPREIAKETQIPIKRVYQLRRQIKSVIDSIIPEMGVIYRKGF